jgi:hypothetical protein
MAPSKVVEGCGVVLSIMAAGCVPGVESVRNWEGEMQSRFSTLLTMGLLVAVPVLAKSKTEKVLPSYILAARTVAVVVDPDAGVDPEDPRANQVAQKDVETALLNWGRFEPLIGTEAADLIIVVRKGHGKLVDTTISDPRQNNRAGVINPTDNGISVGAQHGNQPSLGGASNGAGSQPSQSQSPQPQMEVGGVDDSFTVFDGKIKKPLDSSYGWRYVVRDGLKPHSVPAVDEFRKAVAAAEKAKKP